MWPSSFPTSVACASSGTSRTALEEEAQFQRDKSLADALNKRFQNGIIVKLLATRPGGIHKTGFDKKVSQVLGLRHGQQPEQEGYLSLGWNLEEWPRCKNHSSGYGIAGNWFTSASFVNEELASPYRAGETDNELREAGTSLYGCNRYACGRTPESHKILAVFQPNPIVGCAFIEDAGTNQAIGAQHLTHRIILSNYAACFERPKQTRQESSLVARKIGEARSAWKYPGA